LKGKRELGRQEGPSVWQQYREYVENMSRGQRIRRRILQVLTAISAVIVAVAVFLALWVKPPEITAPGTAPVQSGSQQTGTVGAKGNRALSDQNGDPPVVTMSGQREGVYTFLLVGRDTGGGGLTDTILLLTYDVNAKTITGLNIPRDTMLNVKTVSKRINAVYNYNKGSDPDTQVEKGMEALKQWVGRTTGIVPNFYVILEWEAVGKLVEAVGGVTFTVPYDMNYDDPFQDLHIHQSAGTRLLNGQDAMEVIRYRQDNNGKKIYDDGRIKIQQDFLKAVAKKCLQPDIVLKIPDLAQIFTENVVTDLPLNNIVYFAQQAIGMDVNNSIKFYTPDFDNVFYNGASMVVLKQAELLEVVNSGLNPYEDQVTAQDLQLIYQNKNGTFGVTNAALADERMGQKRSTPSTPAAQPSDPSAAETTPSQEPANNPADDPSVPPPGVPVESTEPVEPAQPNDSGLVIEPEAGHSLEGNANG